MTKTGIEECRKLLIELLLAMADLGESMGKDASDVALVRKSSAGEVDELCDLAIKGLSLSDPEANAPRTEGVTIPLPLAQALADGADSLPVWELRGLLERVAPPSPLVTK